MVLVFLTSVFSMIPPLSLCLGFFGVGGAGVWAGIWSVSVNIFCEINTRFYIIEGHLTICRRNKYAIKSRILDWTLLKPKYAS